MWIILLKGLFLALMIVYSFSNLVKMLFYRHNNITGAQVWLMAIGIAGFVTMQCWLKV